MSSSKKTLSKQLLVDWSAVLWAGMITGVLSLPILFFIFFKWVFALQSQAVLSVCFIGLKASFARPCACFYYGHL